MQYLAIPGQEERQYNYQPFQHMENSARPVSRVVSPISKPSSPPTVIHKNPSVHNRPLSPRITYENPQIQTQSKTGPSMIKIPQ